MEQLSGQDASFLYFETPTSHMHVASVSLYDQSTAPREIVRFRDIKDNIRKRLHLARCFRRKLVEVPFSADHPYWIEDDNFDLEYHVRHVALPPPGDWRQLCRQVARLHSIPLERHRPLWELTVISGLQNVESVPDSAFAIMLKIHHAAIDGASGAALSEVLHDLKAKPARLPLPDKPWAGEPVPSAAELGMRTFTNNLLQPMRFAEVWARGLPAMQRAASSVDPGGAAQAQSVPRTRFNRAITGHRVMDGREYQLADVRKIRAAVRGATVNDVVLGVVGGGLRRYLEARSELPDTTLTAMAPVNVRTEAEKHTEGNRVSAMLAPLGTHLADCTERLALVHAATTRSKSVNNAIGAALMTDYSQFIPSQLAGLAARMYTTYGMAERTAPTSNCVVTNVPGPQAPLYMSGAKLLRTYGLGPLFDGVGLIFPVFSYNGGITISATSCREIVPDIEALMDNIDDSFAEYLSASGAGDSADAATGAAAQETSA